MATTENTAMATSVATPVATPVVAETSTPSPTQGDWIKERSTVRAYWKWITVKVKNKKTGVVTEKQKAKLIAKAGTEGGDNWKKIEEEKDKEGNPIWHFFSENSFERHTVKTMDAFNLLVPEQEEFDQRAYVANAGVNYVQNSKMNALAVETKESTGINGIPPEPAHNQEEIDLASYINEKPGRRIKTNEEKLDEMLEKMGMDATSRALFLQSMQAKYAAAAASGVSLPSSVEEGEEEEEEGEEEAGEETPA